MRQMWQDVNHVSTLEISIGFEIRHRHRLICGDNCHDARGEGGGRREEGGLKMPSLPELFFPSPAIPTQLSCCLSLPICCLNAALLEAHQPWSVSCYRREVKRLFQLLSYWLRPPSGQARPSVNPARNERRSLPTEEVSLWVYVTCPPTLTRQIGSAGMGWAGAYFLACV